MVDLETKAWDEQDVEVLLSLFHRDMVWPWPRDSACHDPMDWEITQGRYDYRRWKDGWNDLFASAELVRNVREIRKIELSKEGDAAFAVVDIDTVWKDRVTGAENAWKGRVCKVYSKCPDGWKITMHTGVLDYSKAG